MRQILVPDRFQGPARSGNGGYVAGSLAEELGETSGRAVTVTLRQPPPLEATMLLTETDAGLEMTFGGAVVAVAEWAGDTSMEPVEAVSWEEALAAEPTYPGLRFHPFPTCFVCGTERTDGLRIFPGQVPAVREGHTRVAGTWVPDLSVSVDADLDAGHDAGPGADLGADLDRVPRARLAATWAALDCVSGWAGDLTDRLMVLGRMTALVDELPVVGEQHVVTGEHRGSEGRRTFTASTLHDADGRIVGRAEHVWFASDPDLFNG